MAAIANILWAILAPVLRPMGRRILWSCITEAAEKGTTEAGEEFRSSNLAYLGRKIDAARARLPKEGDHAMDHLGQFLAGYYHSNRMEAMGRGASWESASVSAEEVWGRVDPNNLSRFSGERQP